MAFILVAVTKSSIDTQQNHLAAQAHSDLVMGAAIGNGKAIGKVYATIGLSKQIHIRAIETSS